MTTANYFKVVYHIYAPISEASASDEWAEGYDEALDFYLQFIEKYDEAHLHKECYRTEEEYEDGDSFEEDCLLSTEREEVAE